MSALGTKLRRDLWRLKGQVLTIALVLACGFLALIMLRSTYQSLVAARDAYYVDYRFGDVFARLERAPDAVGHRLEALPGVARVYTRIVKDIMVPLATEPDPITGRIVTIPDDGVAPLGALYLRSGRLPVAGAADEAVILEQFAGAHGLVPGDRLPAVMNGQLRQLRIVGIALSPEYVLAMSGRGFGFDQRAFVVIWMLHGAVAPVFRLEGGFNDVVIKAEPGASIPAVLDAVDRELTGYGGFHAVGRDRQMSNYALTGELDSLRNLALIIPAVFLGVAAFLVNVVVSRLVFLERTQIAVLKAVGFTDRRIALHYLGLVASIALIGAVLGVGSGVRASHWMTDLYADFYRFPTRVYSVSPRVVVMTLAIGLLAAVTGALGAVFRIARMPPAQAMRPPAPLAYRKRLAEWLGLGRVLGPSALMVVREIERRPVRFLFSVAGIAMGIGMFIFGRFSWDSFDYLLDEIYLREHREDLTVTLSRPVPAGAIGELAKLPGVELAEGERTVGVRIHAGSRWRDIAITGYAPDAELHPPPAGLPDDGILVTDQLAEILQLRIGDVARVEILEGDWPVKEIVVRGVVDEAFGIQGHARADWLDHLLRVEPRVSTVLLRVAPGRLDEVRGRLKEVPAVVGVTSTERTLQSLREQTGGWMVTMTLILGLSAAAIAVGIVYNNARIALSLRSRDLATLRVLGFTRREISAVLLGELGAQVVCGVPLGLLVGTWWAQLFALTIDQEVMRLPVHIESTTYAIAAAIAVVSGAVSALLVRRKLDRLDLVEVLKASD